MALRSRRIGPAPSQDRQFALQMGYAVQPLEPAAMQGAPQGLANNNGGDASRPQEPLCVELCAPAFCPTFPSHFFTDHLAALASAAADVL